MCYDAHLEVIQPDSLIVQIREGVVVNLVAELTWEIHEAHLGLDVGESRR